MTVEEEYATDQIVTNWLEVDAPDDAREVNAESLADLLAAVPVGVDGVDVGPVQYKPEHMKAVFDLGFEILKDTESDYYLWSARNWAEQSPATFSTPDEAAESCINTYGEGV